MVIRVIISFCVFVVTGCLAQDCQELRNCTDSLTGLDTSTGAPLMGLDPTLTADLYLHDTCTRMTQCHQKTGSCTDSGQLLILTIGDYLCREDNRDQLNGVFASPCATNSTLQLELATEQEACMTTYIMAMEAVRMRMQLGGSLDFTQFCPPIDQFRMCMINTANDMCGQDTGNFSNQMFKLMLNNVLPPQLLNCFEQVQVTRRDLESFMPHLAKKHFSGQLPFW